MYFAKGYQYHLDNPAVPDFLHNEFLAALSHALMLTPKKYRAENSIPLMESVDNLFRKHAGLFEAPVFNKQTIAQKIEITFHVNDAEKIQPAKELSPEEKAEKTSALVAQLIKIEKKTFADLITFSFGRGNKITLTHQYPSADLLMLLKQYGKLPNIENQGLGLYFAVLVPSLIGIATWAEKQRSFSEGKKNRILAKLAYQCARCIHIAEMHSLDKSYIFEFIGSDKENIVTSSARKIQARKARPGQQAVKDKLANYWSQNSGVYRSVAACVTSFKDTLTPVELAEFSKNNILRTLEDYLRHHISTIVGTRA